MRWLLYILPFLSLPVYGQDTPAAAPARITDTLRLNEVRVRGRKTFREDSLEKQLIYGKAFRDEKRKVTVTLSNGIVFHGLPSAVAAKLSGRQKKLKRFVREFNDYETAKYTALRYNSELVTRVTGLPGDSAALFLQAVPLPQGMARTASDLELMMWIRTACRQWIASGRVIMPDPALRRH
jgi:hypothetical protein